MSPAPSPRPRRQVWSIRWLVAGAMMLLTAAAVLSVGAVSQRNARAALLAEFEARLALQARNLSMVSSGALLTEVPEWTLLPLLKEIRGRQPELTLLDIVDRDGVIRADADVRRLGSSFPLPPGLEPQPRGPVLMPGEQLLGNRELLVVAAPIEDGQGRALGTVWVGLQRAAVERRLGEARREQALVLVVFLVLGTVAALVLSATLLRPVAALRAGLERIGRGDLDTPLEVRDRTEIGALAGTVNRMARELKAAQGAMVERERIAAEVQLARRIQRSLLPAVRREAGPFVIEGEQRAAAEVGGDYYQMLDLRNGRVGVVIADVSGKGLGGSMVTAMLHALLRAIAASFDSPALLLAALDRQLGGMLERGSFVTMFYGILDPATGELTFASAGHNPLLVLRAGASEPEWMRAPGAPLAALRGKLVPRYSDLQVRTAPGDLLLQYTDGISEAFAADGVTSFGLERVAAVAGRARAGGSRAVLVALEAAVAEWRAGQPTHDDDTVLVISRELDARPAPPGPAPAAAGGGSHDSGTPDPVTERAALALLARAQAGGRHLSLPADLALVGRIEAWLGEQPELAALPARAAGLLKLAVIEACSNVIEHACGGDPRQSFDLWWVPTAAEPGSAANGTGGRAGGPAPPARPGGATTGSTGNFVVRDRGRSFRYQEWRPPSLSDPEVRKRGRGLGLEIVRRVMSRVESCAGTPEGNLTILTFDPKTAARQEELHEYHDRA